LTTALQFGGNNLSDCFMFSSEPLTLNRHLDAVLALAAQGFVVMLSDRTWRRYFLADPTILDRRITLSGVQTRVIGVMPEVFRFPSLAAANGGRDSTEQLAEVPEFWVPAPRFSRMGPSQGFSLFRAFALLKPGATLEQARAEVQATAGPLPNGRQHAIEVVSGAAEMALPYQRVLRNQSYLQGKVVGFRRPFPLYGRPEHGREVASQLDAEFLSVRRWSQHDGVHQAAQGP
jgi:hypothetical protein